MNPTQASLLNPGTIGVPAILDLMALIKFINGIPHEEMTSFLAGLQAVVEDNHRILSDTSIERHEAEVRIAAAAAAEQRLEQKRVEIDRIMEEAIVAGKESAAVLRRMRDDEKAAKEKADRLRQDLEFREKALMAQEAAVKAREDAAQEAINKAGKIQVEYETKIAALSGIVANSQIGLGQDGG